MFGSEFFGEPLTLKIYKKDILLPLNYNESYNNGFNISLIGLSRENY